MKTPQWRRAVENRCVFSPRLKALSDKSGDHSPGGRRFHVRPVPDQYALATDEETSSQTERRDRRVKPPLFGEGVII